MTAGEQTEKLDKFGPRTRDWYQLAKEAKKPVFAPVYKYFAMNDLAISASYPIYDQQDVLKGVLGTHITLSKINGYLKKVVQEKNASAFIVERSSGELIGNSLELPNFVTGVDGETRRVSIESNDNKIIAEAYRNYKNEGRNYSVEKAGSHNLHVKISEFNKRGLDWLIITAISDSKYEEKLNHSLFMAVLLSILAIIGMIFIWTKSLDSYFKPVYSRNKVQRFEED